MYALMCSYVLICADVSVCVHVSMYMVSVLLRVLNRHVSARVLGGLAHHQDA